MRVSGKSEKPFKVSSYLLYTMLLSFLLPFARLASTLSSVFFVFVTKRSRTEHIDKQTSRTQKRDATPES